jgi:hypothetical protein
MEGIFEQEKRSTHSYEYLIYLSMALVVGAAVLTMARRAWKVSQTTEEPPAYPENDPVPAYTTIDITAVQEPPPAYV